MNNRYESKFCTELQRWLKYNIKDAAFMAIEAKISMDNKPLNYKSSFKPHQLPTLTQVKHRTFSHKLSDLSRLGTPFDLFFSQHGKNIYAYVAIQWIRRGNKKFYLIDVDTIQGRIDDGKKSLTEKEAAEIADIIGELGHLENTL